MNEIFEKLRSACRGEIRQAEMLSRHTTWRIGGPADLFLVPADREDLLVALKLLAAAGVPWVPFGAGSNLLVRDGGFRGAAIHLGRLRQLRFGPERTAVVGGGLPLNVLIQEAAARGLAGLEKLAGIPGTVGGALIMNAGAHGAEMAGVVSAAILAGPAGEETWEAKRLDFSYRRSAVPADRVVAEALLRFTPGEPSDLQEEIGRRLAFRHGRHPLQMPNAGSVFKNPPGQPAGRLIEAAGLRGVRAGGAQVSELHANFIVNTGGATAGDVLALIGRIRDEVLKQTGIQLEPEVRIIGEDQKPESRIQNPG